MTSTYQPNFGTIFVRLKPWDERQGPRAARQGASWPACSRSSRRFPRPSSSRSTSRPSRASARRRGSSSCCRTGAERSRSSSSEPRRSKFLAEARKRPELANLFTSFDPNYPQVKVELDREKARSLGVPINEVFQAMSTVLGGSYVNDFNRFGRLFRVYVQAEADYRKKPSDIGDVYVRSRTGGTMIPLSTLDDDHVGAEHRDHHALQPVPVGGDQRGPRARVRVRAGPRRARGGLRRDDAEGDGLRVLEPLVPGEGGPARGADLHPRHRVRLPPARRDVRELAAAVGGPARLPARRPRRLLRRVAHGLRQQRLRPDRQHHADRAGRQERHPDRRVREGEEG